ncbi:uncharacterized protein LOC132565580 [Ylistrum balloti]|uniref:uncharacterized protein LOC132565580 n=1 Tax=Ylistrum balloti TaxID=509963 RepID=UPI002905C8CB|nr:uncharacterized protein LOC132565580 [Ylistrum balloti]
MAIPLANFHKNSKLTFEHIKHEEPCPLTTEFLTQLLQHPRYKIDNDSISPLLVQILDDCHGSEEMVNNRRKVMHVSDKISNADDKLLEWFSGGSVGEGFRLKTSDEDVMYIMKSIIVTYPDRTHFIPKDELKKTILYMSDAHCRPGYVTLEIAQLAVGEGCTSIFQNAIVPVGDSLFVSSDIYRQGRVDLFKRKIGIGYVSNGPCASISYQNYVKSLDFAVAFPCVCWPNVAAEWIHRVRLHGWPTQTLINRILKDGCQVVPVGDKCSTDTLLQWRISFVCAEQILIHSLSHSQFRVYGLLKYFLTLIKDTLKHIIGDDDILCSYFLKTVIFHAVENSPASLWVDQNTFVCFRFCLSILIAWVRAGYCPNYFIRNNNLFLRKIHGENRKKLLHFLIDLHDLNWMCLCLDSKDNGVGRMLLERQNPTSRELMQYRTDIDLFRECLFQLPRIDIIGKFSHSLKCLHVSQSDSEDLIAYSIVTAILCGRAHQLFGQYNVTESNKSKYVAMKKCRHLMTSHASMCTSPGVMMLATCHFLTGNYNKTLQMCTYMRLTNKLFICLANADTDSSEALHSRTYKSRNGAPLLYQMYSGQKNTCYQRFKEWFYSCLVFTEHNILFCIPHLQLEVKMHNPGVLIPPLPYAAFLSFLCYHELGDLRGRDKELLNLRAANYDPEQGGHRYWINHTLLGICYQTVGDIRSAIRSFTDYVETMSHYNPAVERIETLLRSS